MMTHPEVENIDEEGNKYYVDVRFYDDCTTCHTSEEIDSKQLIAYEMVKPHSYDPDNSSYEEENYFEQYDRMDRRTTARPNFPWWVEFAPILRGLPLPSRSETGNVNDNPRSPGVRDVLDRGGLNNLRLPSRSSGGSGISESVNKDSKDESKSANERRSNNTRNNRGNRSSNSRRK
jgi:hypothetical protein